MTPACPIGIADTIAFELTLMRSSLSIDALWFMHSTETEPHRRAVIRREIAARRWSEENERDIQNGRR
jgi:hypothetical protein